MARIKSRVGRVSEIEICVGARPEVRVRFELDLPAGARKPLGARKTRDDRADTRLPAELNAVFEPRVALVAEPFARMVEAGGKGAQVIAECAGLLGRFV